HLADAPHEALSPRSATARTSTKRHPFCGTPSRPHSARCRVRCVVVLWCRDGDVEMSRYKALFQTIDAMDADAFVEWLTDDGFFVYGSSPAVEGKEAVREYVAGFFAGLETISHELLGEWEAGNEAFVEGRVTYGFPGGGSASLRFLNKFERVGDKIRGYRIYIDPTP